MLLSKSGLDKEVRWVVKSSTQVGNPWHPPAPAGLLPLRGDVHGVDCRGPSLPPMYATVAGRMRVGCTLVSQLAKATFPRTRCAVLRHAVQ